MKKTETIGLAILSLTLCGCSYFHIGETKKEQSVTATTAPSPLQEKIAAYTARVQAGLDDRVAGTMPKAAPIVPDTQPATRPAHVEAATQPATMPSQASTRPAEVAATRPASIQEILPLLRQRAAEQSQNLSLAMAIRLLEDSLSPVPLAPIPGTPMTQDERIVADLTNALRAINSQPTDNMATRAAPIIELAKAYAAEGDLKIPVLALASRVDSYGVYLQINDKLPAGKRTAALLYCELRNFVSTKDDKGFTTRLTQQDTLLTSDGMLVWRSNPEQYVDVCRNARQDFYSVKRVTFPESLPAGRYTLKMVVTDQASNKIATASINIQIGG